MSEAAVPSKLEDSYAGNGGQQDSSALSSASCKSKAFHDIKEGVRKWRIWFLLAQQDIKLRYRRSVLGPFWITISMAITVGCMGFLYSHLFRMNLQSYFPFLTAGMLGWSLISTVITDMAEGFTISDGLLKQIKLPYSLYIHRIAWRNMIIFFHNVVVFVPVILLFHQVAKVDFNTLMLVPGLLLIYLNAFFYGAILALLGARYRDFLQIVKSLIQVVFFITPVMWSPAVLPPSDHFIFEFNPVYAFIELIRAPLMGQSMTLYSWAMVAVVSAVGGIVAWVMFAKYRARIIYWL